MNRIDCKYSEIIIAPGNAFGKPMSDEYITADGKEVAVRWISCWNNENGQYDDVLNDECMRLWKMPFASLKSLWISRLGSCDGFWHKVELKLIR